MLDPELLRVGLMQDPDVSETINLRGRARSSRGDTHSTALEYAAFHGYLQCVQLLLEVRGVSLSANQTGGFHTVC